MADTRIADGLARLTEHAELHLPLRRTDVLGRLALRLLWKRQLKWQVEANFAARDALTGLADRTAGHDNDLAELRAAAADLADREDLATTEQLRTELAALRQSDQNIMAGLNQRLYSSLGRLQTQLSDVQRVIAESTESASDTEQRLKALEQQVATLGEVARDVRTRHAQIDLFLEEARAARRKDPAVESAGAAAAAAVPGRQAYLEVAVSELLDGPEELLRDARQAHLPEIVAAREAGATGPVLDLAPGRGELLAVLRDAGIPAQASSVNPVVRAHCADRGLAIGDQDPLAVLADSAARTLGAVTAFRFVERQAPETITSFVAHAFTALQPGGLLLVETPTADGRAAFHLDPFAVRPVHPEFLRFAVEAAGFAAVEIRPDEDRYLLLARR